MYRRIFCLLGLLALLTGSIMAGFAQVPILTVPDLTVRGTVEAVDLRRGAFVLRINHHTRTVFVTEDTDVSGLGRAAVGHFAVTPGQRVTVAGPLQPDGTVLAGLLSLSPNTHYRTAPGLPNRILIGAISSSGNKLFGRDIKIRAADGTETKVKIPRGIPVRRAGRQISVYDLSRADMVRIVGTMDAGDLDAARIDVLAPASDLPSDAAPANAPPARPGL